MQVLPNVSTHWKGSDLLGDMDEQHQSRITVDASLNCPDFSVQTPTRLLKRYANVEWKLMSHAQIYPQEPADNLRNVQLIVNARERVIRRCTPWSTTASIGNVLANTVVRGGVCSYYYLVFSYFVKWNMQHDILFLNMPLTCGRGLYKLWICCTYLIERSVT